VYVFVNIIFLKDGDGQVIGTYLGRTLVRRAGLAVLGLFALEAVCVCVCRVGEGHIYMSGWEGAEIHMRGGKAISKRHALYCG
jgi:hypothetical protein